MPNINQVQVGNTTYDIEASQLATARSIDGVAFNGSADIIHYGVCSTAAGTAAKTASITGFSLVAGARVTIKFTDANTAASPTLNISSTGAKAITVYGSTAAASGQWNAGSAVDLVYDGTYWVIVGIAAVDPTSTVPNAAASAAVVGDLKSAFITEALSAFPNISLSDFLFILGTFSTSDGSFSELTTSTRLISKNLVEVGAGSEINIASGYKFVVLYYNKDGSYIGYEGWNTGLVTIKSDSYIRIALAYTGDNSMSDTSISQYLSLSAYRPNLYTIIKRDWDASNWTHGVVSVVTADGVGGIIQNNTARLCSNFFPLTDTFELYLDCPQTFKYRCVFYDKTFSSLYTSQQSNWLQRWQKITIPNNAVYYRITVGRSDDQGMVYTDNTGLTVWEYHPQTLDSYIGLKSKKISLMGDSITTYGGIDAVPWGNTTGCSSDGVYTYEGNFCRYPQSNLALHIHDMYWMRLIDYYQMVLGANESIAGSRVSWDGTTATGVKSKDNCMSSQTRINHLGSNGTPDIILVNAGTNDIGDYESGAGTTVVGTFNTENPANYTDEQIANLPVETFADAFRTMLIRLLKTYTTSKIVVMLPNYTTTYYTATEADIFCEVIKEECDYFGIQYVDVRQCNISVFNATSYLPDGVHPNEKGMFAIYKTLKPVFDNMK